MEKGFTLVELLVVLVILAIVSAIAIAAINPIEQLRRARDAARNENAYSLLRAIERYQAAHEKSPEILAFSDSVYCSDIIEAGPAYDISSLENEVPEWFPKMITQEDSQLYLGISKEGRTKACFLVEAVSNIAKSQREGCSVPPYYYLCVPD